MWVVHFPYSHSLVFSLFWSVLLALPFFIGRRLRDGMVLAGCVFSHFVLDVASHSPDMPLWPGGRARWGLGLWYSVPATLVVEGRLLLIGIVAYLRSTRAIRPFGNWGFWALMALLIAGWLNGPFGPPPPHIQVVAWSALTVLAIIVGWAWAVERARAEIAPQP